MDRELSRRSGSRREGSADRLSALHNPESTIALLGGLFRTAWCFAQPPGIAVGLAPGGAGFLPSKEPTGDVEYRVGIELVPVAPEGPEADAFAMPQQPGRLVVPRKGPVVQYGDPEQHLERGAVGSHGGTRWGDGAGARGHGQKIPGAPRTVALARSDMYICELVHKAVRMTKEPVPRGGISTILPKVRGG